ncbi:MAG: general secretion pathway protein G [Parasphingorhabdus sp.]
MNNSKKSKGFTLIEIMVVVVIIGLMATLILPRVLGRQEEAFIAKSKSDIRALTSALKLYKLDNFKYPTTSDGLDVLVSGAKDGKGYIDRLPSDPWGNSYQFLFPGDKMEFDLWSYGADGQTGGESTNADIGNWNLDE